MIQFLTTPIFYLEPWIFLWGILCGLIVIGIIRALKFPVTRKTPLAAGSATMLAIWAWNWSIEFNRSTIYLNVDHPIFIISWADAICAICVFAAVAFVLGWFVNRNEPAGLVIKIAGIAALVTLLADTFVF